jgi:hypothetical protein
MTKPTRTQARRMERSLLRATMAFCSVALLGCSTPRGVPAGANLVTEATVKSSFQAPTDGMLWIFRSPARGSRGQLHYSGPIAAGQVLVVDPSMNRATIDGEPLELVLPGGDVWYQAYFKPDSRVRRVLATRTPGRAAPTTNMTNESETGGAVQDAASRHEIPSDPKLHGTE